MKIIESNIIGKKSQEACEDGLVMTDDFIAVIDGSTSKKQKIMRMKMRENEQSFVFGVSVSDYNFIGRKEEIRRLKMNFLRCILSGHHDDFGETAVREEFQLGSVSNITRLKTALVDKDIVEMSGKRYYITDPVFALWFRSRMF